jgi:hypothetical protein
MKSISFLCDRCGGEVVSERGNERPLVSMSTRSQLFLGGRKVGKERYYCHEYDLCSKCYLDVRNFIQPETPNRPKKGVIE